MPTHTHKCMGRARPPKPVVTIDSTVGGRLIIGNTTAAAKWLGMRQQDFYRIVKNILRPPKRVVAYQRKVDAVKAAYPELFEIHVRIDVERTTGKRAENARES